MLARLRKGEGAGWGEGSLSTLMGSMINGENNFYSSLKMFIAITTQAVGVYYCSPPPTLIIDDGWVVYVLMFGAGL